MVETRRDTAMMTDAERLRTLQKEYAAYTRFRFRCARLFVAAAGYVPRGWETYG